MIEFGISIDDVRCGLINVRRGHIIDANGDHWIRVPPDLPATKPTSTCCGTLHDTPFCPNCGKKLHPIKSPYGLLAYVRNMANTQRTAANNWAAMQPAPSGRYDTPWGEEMTMAEWRCRNESTEVCAQRWETWAAQLQHLLDQQYSEKEKVIVERKIDDGSR